MYNERLALGRNRAAHAYKQKERYMDTDEIKLADVVLAIFRSFLLLASVYLSVCFFPKEIEHIDIR